MAKTSTELLSDILSVLGKINSKLDHMKSKGDSGAKPFDLKNLLSKKEEKTTKDTSSKSFDLKSLFVGKSGKTTTVEQLANDLVKLNKEIRALNITKLNSLIKSMNTYDKLSSKPSPMVRKISNVTAIAKEAATALLYMGGAILAFTGTMLIASTVIGVTPLGVLGFVIGTAAALALSMMILSGGDAIGEKIGGKILNIRKDKGRTKGAIENAKDLGVALMFIAGGILAFGLVLGLAGAVLGVVGVLGVPLAIFGIMVVLGASMVVLATLTASGDKASVGKGKTKDAIQNARDMGIALMFIAGGILAFGVTLAVLPMLLKTEGILGGVGVIVAIIAGMAGVFFLLGKVQGAIDPGIAVATGMGIAIGIISLAILAVAFTSKILTSMFKPADKNKDGTEKSGFMKVLGTVGNALGALGMFGLFLVALAGTLWVLGLPIVSGPILLGSLAMIGMAVSLIVTANAIKKVMDIMGQFKVKDIKKNIKDMVGGVISGVIEGVMGSGVDKDNDGQLSIREVMQFRRMKRIIRMLGSIASSLSDFARGLMAFAKVGEIASLDYDENGKPKIGKTVHVTQIASAIADTFGTFIKMLVENTQSLTRKQARALKILGKALTGDRGIISAVNAFSQTLKIFAEFGAKGEVWVPKYDEHGVLIENQREAVPIKSIVQNIVNGFGTFVDEIVKRAPEFEAAGGLGKKMLKFSEALMGQSKGFLRRAKPGILSAITEFSNVLQIYAEYGKDGKFPKKDKDGNIIAGQYYLVSDIATNMVSGISTFMTALDVALSNGNLEKSSDSVSDKLDTFSDIISQFDKLAEAQEGMDKLANSMGLLATNIGLLVTNMGGLNTDNLSKLATITAQHAVSTKGVTIQPQSGTSGSSAPTAMTAKFSDEDLQRLGQIIAAEISKTKTGVYDFTFWDGKNGGKLQIK